MNAHSLTCETRGRPIPKRKIFKEESQQAVQSPFPDLSRVKRRNRSDGEGRGGATKQKGRVSPVAFHKRNTKLAFPRLL